MKKLMVLLVIVLTSITAFGAVGTVDSQRVAQSYSGYKDAMEFLQKESKRLQEDINTRKMEYEAEVKTYVEKYNINVSTSDAQLLKAELDKNLTDKEKEELGRAENALQTYFKMIQNSLAQQEAEQMNRVRTDIQVAIKEIAKQEGLEVVLEKQTVVYGGSDITEKVINFLEGAEKIELQ